ncbi:MAG: zinc ribbon domain-containing protein [Anaerolineales bacterium]
MSRASGLYRLQEIDRETDRLKGRLEEIRVTLEDSSEITQLKADRDVKEAAMADSSAAARRAENDVEDQRLKIQNTEQALYGGDVKNPKELEDLQMESDSLKRHLETLEDRYLEAMLEQDEKENALKVSSAALEATETRLASLHKDLISEQENHNERLASLEAEREVALASMSNQDSSTYEALRTRLMGVAVVELNGDSCGACGLTLSASSRQLVVSGDELVNCTQCSRILYGG